MIASSTAAPKAHWSRPSYPYLKVNIDASWKESTNDGFVGIVMRDVEGQFVVTARYAIKAPHVATAEAIAIMRGCELAIALGDG